VTGGAVVGGKVVGVTVSLDGDGVGVTEGDGDTIVVLDDGATLGAGETVVSFPYEDSSNKSPHSSSTTSWWRRSMFKTERPES